MIKDKKKRKTMKFREYSKDIQNFLESLRKTHTIVTNFGRFFYFRHKHKKYLANYPGFDQHIIEGQKLRKEIISGPFKNYCREIIKNTNKIINHVHKLGQASDIDLLLFNNFDYLKETSSLREKISKQVDALLFNNFDYLKETSSFREKFSKQVRELSYYKDLEANKEFKKSIERTCGELDKIINKLNALNAEIKKIKGHVQEVVQEVEFKMSKRETETLNLERFSEFKGKINTKILFSIFDYKRSRVNLKRKNSEGKLDAKFGTEKATIIRSETRRLTAPLDSRTQSVIRDSTADDIQQAQRMIEKIEPLMPPAGLIKKFKIKNFDKYQQLIKNKTIEALKKVFENNTKFFYGHYGKYFNININLFLVLQEDFFGVRTFQAFVRSQKKVLSSIQTPIDPKRDFKTVSVIDPHNIEIFISMKHIAEQVTKENLKPLEQTILHELTHWFTKHINQDENTLHKLFSEGLAVFSEYCAEPEHTLKEWLSPDKLEGISRMTNGPRSIEEMENDVSLKNPYTIGLYMWLTIYAYKSQKKDGRKCFEPYINTARLIKIAYKDAIENTCTHCGFKSLIKIAYKDAIENTCTHCGFKSLIKIVDKEAIKWLRVFRNLMTPNLFFKQYAEATKKMNVRSTFNKAAMEFLIETANEETAKRKKTS